MLIAHAGLVGFALEGGLLVVPITLWLVLRKRFRVNKVGGPTTTPAKKGRSKDPSGTS
ncbi:MAG: hypothetical protein ACRDV9_03580 [Acidimicrobiia bacterium]